MSMPPCEHSTLAQEKKRLVPLRLRHLYQVPKIASSSNYAISLLRNNPISGDAVLGNPTHLLAESSCS